MKVCRTVGLALVCSALVIPSVAHAATPTKSISEISVFPAKLELQGIRDARRLLVTGKSADGKSYDLTGEAKIKLEGSAVKVDASGYVLPVSKGAARLIVSAAGKQVEVAVNVENAEPTPVSFIREVMPVLSKVGCNQGTCHGAQDGKAGFKFSLRGYDPHYDYTALVDEHMGRRFNRSVPAQSLMLLKPTQGVPHVGGFLFDEDSRQYELLLQWIAEGCRFDPQQTRVERLEVYPQNPVLEREGDQLQQVVIARYADGTSRDVTRDVIFSSSAFSVATVTNERDNSGLVKAVRRGETAILVKYEGAFAANNITVLGDRTGYAWQTSPEFNYIDTHVNAKLRKIRTQASDLCTDAEFLRRVSLDLTGLPPSAAQVEAFLKDPRESRAKREAKVDELLDSPEYVDHWTLKWSDLLLSNRKYIGEKGVWSFRNWIRNAIATNRPYDKFVQELVTANGSTYQYPAANYYRISREPRVVMENMTQVFLGTRFSCNRCHDHPFERWTQNQYWELSAYFADVGRKRGSQSDEEVIFPMRQAESVVNPRTNVAVPALFPFEHATSKKSITGGRRDQLSQWLTAKENPYFATSLVNRYWSYLCGRGIIDPVDDIRSSNPPSNPALLKALTDDFVSHNMDLKHLLRTITKSHTYQRSFKSDRWNEDDNENYSHYIPRRLTAEQLFDAIMVATGSPVELPGVPAGFRATQLPDPNIQVGFLDMFGRPPREIPCECERAAEVSLAQTLNLVNGPTISEAIAHPKGLIARTIAAKADDKTLIEQIYIGVLNRHPTAEEQEKGAKFIAEVGNRTEAAQDLMWALMNSPAFLFNR